jgi:hypothetical protein
LTTPSESDLPCSPRILYVGMHILFLIVQSRSYHIMWTDIIEKANNVGGTCFQD